MSQHMDAFQLYRVVYRVRAGGVMSEGLILVFATGDAEARQAARRGVSDAFAHIHSDDVVIDELTEVKTQPDD